jgi:phage shock protein A
MTRGTIEIPALTPELRFALRHSQEMDQLLDGKESEYKEVREEVDRIYKSIRELVLMQR